MAITQDGAQVFGPTSTTIASLVVESISVTHTAERVDLNDQDGEPLGSTVVPGRTEMTATLQLGEGFTNCLYQMAGNVFYGNITPSATNTYDLGSSTHVWRDLYIGDLNLNNETRVNDDGSTGNEIDGTTGNWTIQEGEEHLYIINNKNGKKYKFALEEIE